MNICAYKPVKIYDESGINERFSTLFKNVCYLLSTASRGGIQSIVAGTNISVDDTDPLNPIVSATGGGSVTLQTAYDNAPDDPQLDVQTNAFTIYNVPNFTIQGQTSVNPVLTLKGGTADEGGFLLFKDSADSDILELSGSLSNGNQLGSIGNLFLTVYNNASLKLLTNNIERVTIDEMAIVTGKQIGRAHV